MIYPEFELKPQFLNKFPLNWDEIFGNYGPIHVELGFGNGEYAAYYTSKNKNINYIGFELSITSMVKAQRKLKRNGIKNAKLILCDARFGVREFFSDDSIDKLIMNFPVPWYKNSQAHRRIIIKDFFNVLSVVLKYNGEFELVTDQEWYAIEAYENAKESGYFKVNDIEKNPKREFLTRYEKKWIRFNRDIFRLKVWKIKKGKITRLLRSEDDMPHAVGKITEQKVLELKGQVFKEDNKIFVVKNVYKEVNGDAYIFKIISSDDEFTQHYFLVLYPKEKMKWVLKLDSESNPYRTPAVKWSVKKIMEVLE
ncbi:tRNA (guanine-N7)-methyltransferase [Thermosipho affectus]|uniref:tRNA (guanine-N(7)-)-methyltransferase n=1 Tax=Thermosipho affectus TaxID=660294 RepID=A0ABX3IJN7_9BACT|nr:MULTISPECIES: tRNA (guanosine(46)-N7)-methyltransferase TrmB [Thermosipho]ANQ53006.1 tRNA (guanine-N(7)-)-methyltransferase [Thermosipho sp. 1070]APT71453.1 tRNA (guanine-N7)-methyltransferase [Thermosipho sp. 1063]ONN28037.1 tRNA (guanine-N7)-methyltransferase [Thermosipho affectus]OOC45527.1 tRNA (guanine-N7)-methyltransferase [Thermosipho sp. 1074]